MIGNGIFSQRVYFVYFQTEQGQPFFIKMDNKVYSSESTGYLILSNLHDSTYNFQIGFPGNKWPEQNFSVKVGAQDHGYLVKNFEDKGWGLFDLQTMAVQMAAMEKKVTETNNPANTSLFTQTLAKATGDSTLIQKPVQPKSEVKTIVNVEKPEVVKKDTALSEHLVTIIPETKIEAQAESKNEEQISTVANSYKKSKIIRQSESSTTTGLTITYIDDSELGKDTIRILITEPAQTSKLADREKTNDVKFLDFVKDTTQVSERNGIPDSRNNEATQMKPAVTDTSNNHPPSINNCMVIAEEKDFFTLRKNMASSDGDNKMIEAAKKYFKSKCFLVSQLKNLSTLFLDDAGKYNFFDAAYSHVSDRENFPSLQAELKDEYYINRFKAMLRN